ncbi:MAG TPA: DUF3341 domain-containing protein [Chthoniobacteraceae bacterium]|nr:DUF3341 domain-containing protein [Chthoniobacteraceae bacterium]
MAEKPPKVYGLGAEFPSASALYHAAEKVRDKGFKRWDTHSPFPIHGMEHAMGLGKSWLSIWVFLGGLTGFTTAVLLEYYATWIDYPLIVHGKPYNWATVPPLFPIMFELTVLFSAFATVFALLGMNLLPMWYHPVFNWDRFAKVTDNGFFLVIEAADPQFSEGGTRQFLEELGGAHVTLIHD